MSKLMAVMAVVTLGLSGSLSMSYGMEEKDETLQGTLDGGMMAIGGETTGWRLKLDDGKSVDILTKDGKKPAEDKDFLGRLQKLDGKKVTAKGQTGMQSWVESGMKKYIKVDSIEEQQTVTKDEKQGNEGDEKWLKEGECNGKHVGTMDIGVCGRCGGETNSGSMKICMKCSSALKVCPFCLKKLKDGKMGTEKADGDKQWIKAGAHDPTDCCDGKAHIQPATKCGRCDKEWVSDGHNLCHQCSDELKICYHCHRKR